MRTNYKELELFDGAVILYQNEIALSQHYETIRSAVTGSNLALVVGVAAFSEDVGANTNIVFVLFIVGVITGLLTIKLSQAHYFHFKLAAKMRGIIARRHLKTGEKLDVVRKEWKHETRYWRWIGNAPVWVVLNFLLPISLAVSLWRW